MKNVASQFKCRRLCLLRNKSATFFTHCTPVSKIRNVFTISPIPISAFKARLLPPIIALLIQPPGRLEWGQGQAEAASAAALSMAGASAISERRKLSGCQREEGRQAGEGNVTITPTNARATTDRPATMAGWVGE